MSDDLRLIFDQNWYEGLANQGYWMDTMGVELSFKAMSIDHLRNCADMIDKNPAHTRAKCLPHLEKELKRRAQS